VITLLAGFLASALLVVLAGTSLAQNGDVIAARTRLGGLWVGSVFLAIATSLPELATDIAAVRLGEPDLAAGDLFGSSMANMLILALVSLLPRGELLFRKAALDHALYAALAIIMTCLAAIFIFVRAPVSVLGIGPGSLVLLATYLIGSRAIFRHTALAPQAGVVAEMGADGPAAAPTTPEGGRTLRRAALGFAGASLIILVAAPVFARTSAGLAEASGLGTTFFGTWLVGFATSLPELVTSLAAVRLQAYDLAVGNLFGSNALNMAMFVPLDVAHSAGPILAVVSSTHALSALVAVVMMATALAALVYRAKGRFAVLEPGSAILLLTYVAGLGLIYLHAAGR
jgi:cation:H+ antiporter